MRHILMLPVVALLPMACAVPPGPASATGGDDGRVTLNDASPRQVAELHYKAIVHGDRELWLETLSDDNRMVADRRGSYPDLWWQTGRRYATQYGVTYRFYKVAEESPNRVKLFFERLNPDGSRRGMPVPIHLVKEEDGWRVKGVTY